MFGYRCPRTMLPHLIFIVLIIILAISSLSIIVVDALSFGSSIFTPLVNAGTCVRLLHQTGYVGCSLPSSGVVGRLRLIYDAASLALVKSQDAGGESTIVVLDQSLFTKSIIQDLSSTINVAGILLLPTDTSSSSGVVPPASGYSPTTSTPQYMPYIPSTSFIPNRPIGTYLFNNTYAWNPIGSDIASSTFTFGIATVTFGERAYIIGLASANEINIASHTYAFNKAQMFTYMYAKDSTPQCLSDTTCMPVGGYSVWGALADIIGGDQLIPVNGFRPVNYTSPLKPFVLATTSMDSTGLFHQLSPGAASSQAAVAVLAGAVMALSSTGGVNTLPSHILFAFFQGESYSHVGSRKFVRDLTNFVCNQPATSDSPIPECNSPYAASLAFQSITIDRILKIVDIGEVGLNSTLFVHRQRDNNAATNSIIATINGVAANMSVPMTVSPASIDTPGIPPSSAEAFINQRPQIGVVVISDHEGPYRNKYLNSQFDVSSTLLRSPMLGRLDYDYAVLCRTSTIAARTLWIEAGGDIATSLTINANCDMINNIVTCMLDNIGCNLVRNVAPTAFTSPTPDTSAYPHYSSVFNMMPDASVDSMPQFLSSLLRPYVMNATGMSMPLSSSTTTLWSLPLHYHSAVDPNLSFDMTANRWRIDTNANDYALWTESNWDGSLGVRMYRDDESRLASINIAAGVIIVLLTIIAMTAMKKYCKQKYKKL